ncbi:methyltransferase domain-containing protein [Aequorivita sp. H23M31]|uniref:Methyltransferase domain-containing protein n=1 Tax=Aequorivita ciconiae TaxID=2494375 RepID=A0A410G105_9FLAO|nr:bifunctional PIG-L family deacetylase/class I SAM-dependent methyltransferase [Aequorivita sp. H23M31]QAA80910.1 methyltransferase domain-containing protein [Aequorivita sp. H23M31]
MESEEHLTSETLLFSPLLASEQLSKQIGNALILAPHPDDEVLGCGGLIQFLLEQNISVFVCFVTSGGASHPNSKEYPPKKLAALREKEAIKSCEILGVKKEDVFFMRQPDSCLSKLNENIQVKNREKLIQILKEFSISSIILPWERDPHPDHIASCKLGKLAAEEVDSEIQLIEYPIWLWKNSVEKDWPLKDEREIYRLEISSKLVKKREAILAHKSQTSHLIDDDPQGFILTEYLLEPFLTPYEFYFFKKPESVPSLTKSYFDTLYDHNPDPWNFRNSDYEKSKYKTIDQFLNGKLYKNGLEMGCSIGIHTSHLANHCKKLLAVDISAEAIETAKKSTNLPNVTFEIRDIEKDFPTGPFQFISMCEMGYYFDKNTLWNIFEHISKNLEINGQFLMVHWTSFVREYPLNGKKVHQLFESFNEKEKAFALLSSSAADRFELMLWEKKG